MTTNTEKLLSSLADYEESPALIQQTVLNLLQDNLDGLDIVDPTNPFMFLLEASSTAAYSAMIKAESVARKIYPKLAQNNDELFYHLSDKDYYGIYATPAKTHLKVLVNFDLLLQNGLEDQSGYLRSSLIPRNTYFQVAGYILGIHYPILITIYKNSNAISVRYQVEEDEVHPLQTLSTNLVEFRTLILNGGRYVELTLPVEQFQIETNYYTLSNTSSFSQYINFVNYFMYVRIWYLRTNLNLTTEWVEMQTTHNARNYDNAKPTMVISVSNNQLSMTFPDIYQFLFKINSIRVDLYTTMGPLSVDLSNTPSSEYQIAWNNINDRDTEENNLMIKSVEKITGVITTSSDWLEGGSAGKSFGQIKEQVVYRDRNQVPMLPSDIIQSMSNIGYLVSKYNDNVTDRVYVATKAIPSYTKNGLNRNVFALLENMIVDTKQDESSLQYALINNGLRTTITPDGIYKWENGEVKLLPDSFLTSLESMSNLEKVSIINSSDYFYTPFFYMIDRTLPTLKCRAYQLDKPVIVQQTFIENIGSEISPGLFLDSIFITGTKEITIELYKDEITNLYEYVITAISSVPKTVPEGSTYTCSLVDESTSVQYAVNVLTTEPVLGKQTFTLRLPTYLDVDQLNEFDVRDFTDINNTNAILKRIGLTHKFKLIYQVDLPTPNQYFRTDEFLEVEFGTYLEGLYIPSKTIISSVEYQTWEVDVPLLYPEDVYERDITGNLVYTRGINNEVILNLIHEADSIVYDSNNAIIYKHRKGEYKTDAFGNLITSDLNSHLLVSIGLFFITANYRFANDPTTVEYRDSISKYVQTYLETEIVPRDQMLNERTDLFYKPKGTIGNIRVTIGNQIETYVDSAIKFKVKIYISRSGYNNLELMKQITLNAKNILVEAIANPFISVYDLSESIRTSSGSEVFNVDIEKFGSSNNIPVMRLVDDSQSFSIKDKLELLPGNILDVVDDIEINYEQIER